MADASHLDHALSEEFADKAETIHALKASDAHFAGLLLKNREIWDQIQRIQNGLAPAEDAVLTRLEKERLALLDEIAARLAAA